MEGSSTAIPQRAGALATLTAWRRNAARPEVWKRALVIGLFAGGLQAAVHQGDAWMRLAVSGPVVFKTLLSPVIAVGIALAAAACTPVER